MTWGMHTVSWLEFGEEELADENFKKMNLNINEPFKVSGPIHETSSCHSLCPREYSLRCGLRSLGAEELQIS